MASVDARLMARGEAVDLPVTPGQRDLPLDIQGAVADLLGWQPTVAEELVAVNMERAMFKREVPHMGAAEVEEIEALPDELLL